MRVVAEPPVIINKIILIDSRIYSYVANHIKKVIIDATPVKIASTPYKTIGLLGASSTHFSSSICRGALQRAGPITLLGSGAPAIFLNTGTTMNHA
jgi:hypothetical protein